MISYPLLLPSTPGLRSLKWRPHTTVALVPSVYTGQQQTQPWPGEWWEADVQLPPMPRETAEEWLGFFAALHGKAGTFLMGDPRGRAPRGVAGGVPYLDGAASGWASSLPTTAWTASQAALLQRGDWLQISKNYTAALSACRAFTPWIARSNHVTLSVGGGGGGADRATPSGSDAWMSLVLAPPLPTRTFVFDVFVHAIGGNFTLNLYVINQAAVVRGVVAAPALAAQTMRFRVSGAMQAADTGVVVQIGGAGSWNVAQGAIDLAVASVCSPDGPDNALVKVAAASASNINGDATIECFPGLHAAAADGSAIMTASPVGLFRLAADPQWSEGEDGTYSVAFSAMEAF